MFGGYPGAPSVIMLKEKTRVNELIAANRPPSALVELGGRGKILPYCNFELKESDVLYMRVAAGGGYGDPLERDPELVRRDVLNQIVSRDAARQIYGVVLKDPEFELDLEATKQLRAAMKRNELGDAL
jgi:N-methylhydantoinase B